MIKRIFIYIVLLILKSQLFAQNVSLIKQNCDIQEMIVINNVIYFSGKCGTYKDIELWKSDGTDAGTVLVKDIKKGSNSSNPKWLTNFNGSLYFAADDSINGNELWRSDGTLTGTTIYKNINAGNASSNPSELFVNKSTLYMAANDGVNGIEPYKVSGATVSLIKDINVGALGSNPKLFSSIRDSILFFANDGVNGIELWKTAGTSANTFLLKDIKSGSAGINPNWVITGTKGLYFDADNGSNGNELFFSNGNSAGTFLVSDINKLGSSNPKYPYIKNDTLYFQAIDTLNNTEIWRYIWSKNAINKMTEFDGTAWGSQAQVWSILGKNVLINAKDKTKGNELFVINSATLNVNLISDFNSGISDALNIYTKQRQFGILWNNRWIYLANNGSSGFEISQTDFTTANTSIINQFYKNKRGIQWDLPLISKSKLFFKLTDSLNISHLASVDCLIPELPKANDVSICGAGIINLSANSADTIMWYNNLDLNTLLNKGKTYKPNITKTETYVLKSKMNQCTSVNSITIKAIVKPIPPKPIANDTIKCGTGITKLYAKIPQIGDTILWYITPTTTGVSYKGNPYNRSMSATDTFYPATLRLGCISKRDTQLVIVKALPIAPTTATTTNFCKTDTLKLTANSLDSIIWFKKNIISNPIGYGSKYSKYILANDTFYVAAKKGTCYSSLIRILAYVRNKPTISITDIPQRCGNGFLLFKATYSDSAIWKNVKNMILAKNNNVLINVNSNDSIWAFPKSAYCYGIPTLAKFLIKPTPPKPIISGKPAIWKQKIFDYQVQFTSDVTKTTWLLSKGNIILQNSNKISISFDTAGLYKLKCVVNNILNCYSDTAVFDIEVREVTFNVKTISSKNISVFPNPAQNMIHVSIDNSNLQYQIFTNSGITLKSGALIAKKIEINELPNGIYFLKLQNNNSIYYSKFIKSN